jgi:hypothetical protein
MSILAVDDNGVRLPISAAARSGELDRHLIRTDSMGLILKFLSAAPSPMLLPGGDERSIATCFTPVPVMATTATFSAGSSLLSESIR